MKSFKKIIFLLLTSAFIFNLFSVSLYASQIDYSGFQKTGRYYDLLSEKGKWIYETLEDNLNNTEIGKPICSNEFIEENDIEKIGPEVAFAFMDDHPEAFWLVGMYWETLDGYGKIYIGKFDNFKSVPYNDLFTSSILDEQNTINQKIQQILSAVEGKSDYQKVYYFNKWLTSHNKYNSLAYTNISVVAPNENIPWSIQSAFLSETNKLPEEHLSKAPVCEGYSEAFKVLCDRSNIPCIIDSTINVHQWNYVKIDGNWYCIDVTWNDPIFDNADGLVPSGDIVNPNDIIENNDSDGILDFFLQGSNNFIDHSISNQVYHLNISKSNYVPTEKVATFTEKVSSVEQVSSKEEVSSVEQVPSKDEVSSVEQVSSKKEVSSVEQVSSKEEVSSVEQVGSSKITNSFFSKSSLAVGIIVLVVLGLILITIFLLKRKRTH